MFNTKTKSGLLTTKQEYLRSRPSEFGVLSNDTIVIMGNGPSLKDVDCDKGRL